MAELPVVAVAGATGFLGKGVVSALLDPQFRSKYKDIVVLSRSLDNPLISSWTQQGVIAREYSVDDDTSIAKALDGVDVLINTLGSVDGGFKAKVAAAVASSDSSVKLYFPSEFGIDHYTNPIDYPEWIKKREHFTAASARKDLKVTRVFPGLFMDLCISPYFGYNTKEGKYDIVGSGDERVSWIASADIGRGLASAIAHIPIEEFPEKLYFSGDAVSPRQIAKLMSAAGGGDIEVSSEDLKAYKESVFSKSAADLAPKDFLTYLMAEGNLNNEKNNSNEWVNPGQKYWKWKTVKDYAEETRGRPWA